MRHPYDIQREITTRGVSTSTDLGFLGCLTSLAALISLNLVAFVHLAWLIGPTSMGPLGLPASMRFRLLCGR